MHWPRRPAKTPYRDLGTRQAQKGGRGGRETGKGGERQKTEGKGEGKKRAQSPFLPYLFMDASKAYMRVAHERNSSWNEATKQAVYDYVYCIVVFFP